MAGEIYLTWPESANIYAIIRDPTDGQVYVADTGSDTFEDWVDGNIGTYDIPLTDYDGNHYSVDFPSDISEGKYVVALFIRAGANPADGDFSPAHGWIDWDGSAEVTPGDIVADIAALEAKVDIIDTNVDTLLIHEQTVFNEYEEEVPESQKPRIINL